MLILIAIIFLEVTYLVWKAWDVETVQFTWDNIHMEPKKKRGRPRKNPVK